MSEAPEYVFGQEHWTYDVESYPNVFTFCILNKYRGISRIFEVSEYLNELDKIYTCLEYLHENDQVMVGFNNLGYDYNILDELLQNRKFFSNKSGLFIAQKLYQKTQEIIEGVRHTGFGSTIPYSDRYVKQLDLFKIWHFDNKAKATSLKMIEFNMREQNIEDLPFPVGSVLTQEQVQILKTYNKHDVNMTDVFREKSKPNIEFRTSLSAKYNRDFSNHNDTKIGKDYFVMRLEEEGIPCYIKENGRRKIRQTKRHWVDIGDCLFDYYDFQEPAFIAVKEWFARQRITETKGVFSDLEEHDLGDVAKCAEFVTKQKKVKSKDDSVADKLKKEHPCGIFVEKTLKATETVKLEDGTKIKRNKTSLYFQWKVAETLNVVVNGFRFDFGVGGIHGSLRSAIVRKDEDTVIEDADVSSKYPNLAISNNVYPKHLGVEFCGIYKDVYDQRKSYPKGSVENAMLKLALNGVYGDSNNPFSPFYDTAYTMTITVNGQLTMCLLAEKLMRIPGLQVIQINTDGITCKMPTNVKPEYDKVCKDWQEQVKLELEYAEYEAMFIRDVNNYIALYTNGKLKNKGAYEYKNLDWHKNQSCLVVPMCAEAVMLKGADPEEFLKEHLATDPKNVFDFMLRTKVPRSSRLVLVHDDGSETQQQNICRYYPSTEGSKLVKIMPALATDEDEGDGIVQEDADVDPSKERRLAIDSDWLIKTCNDMRDYDGSIDLNYYIQEVQKLVILQTEEPEQTQGSFLHDDPF